MEDSMRPFYTGWQSGDALAQGDNSRYTQYGNTALNNTGAQNHEMMQHINKLQQMYLTKTGADGKPLDQESLDYMRDFINANQFAYSQGVMTPWPDDPLAGKSPLHAIVPTTPIEMPPMPTAPVPAPIPPNPYPSGTGPFPPNPYPNGTGPYPFTGGPYNRELMPTPEQPEQTPNPYPYGTGPMPWKYGLGVTGIPSLSPHTSALPETMPAAPKSAAPKMPPAGPAKRKLKNYKPTSGIPLQQPQPPRFEYSIPIVK